MMHWALLLNLYWQGPVYILSNAVFPPRNHIGQVFLEIFTLLRTGIVLAQSPLCGEWCLTPTQLSLSRHKIHLDNCGPEIEFVTNDICEKYFWRQINFSRIKEKNTHSVKVLQNRWVKHPSFSIFGKDVTLFSGKIDKYVILTGKRFDKFHVCCGHLPSLANYRH